MSHYWHTWLEKRKLADRERMLLPLSGTIGEESGSRRCPALLTEAGRSCRAAEKTKLDQLPAVSKCESAHSNHRKSHQILRRSHTIYKRAHELGSWDAWLATTRLVGCSKPARGLSTLCRRMAPQGLARTDRWTG